MRDGPRFVSISYLRARSARSREGKGERETETVPGGRATPRRYYDTSGSFVVVARVVPASAEISATKFAPNRERDARTRECVTKVCDGVSSGLRRQADSAESYTDERRRDEARGARRREDGRVGESARRVIPVSNVNLWFRYGLSARDFARRPTPRGG